MKKVSVIVPAYNKADLTVKTAESVLSQTYKNIEVIIVDDGSTDNTRQRLSPYFDRIRYVYKENGGACSARNLGIRLATGDYIGLLDCDDIYLPQKIEKSVAYLERNSDFGFVHTSAYLIDENDAILRIYSLRENRHIGWIAKRLLSVNYICNSTVVIRKSCFEKVGLFDETIFFAADWDMWLRLAEQYKGGYINAPFTLYRVLEHYKFNHLNEAKEEQLFVLKKAFQRNPGLNPRLKDKFISNVYYRQAVDYLAINDFRRAREELISCVRKCALNTKAHFLLISIVVLGKNLSFILKCFKRFLAIKKKKTNMVKIGKGKKITYVKN